MAAREQPVVAAQRIQEQERSIVFGRYQFNFEESTDCALRPGQKPMKVDYEKLIFPLTVRLWQEGDFFMPLGMSGKKKLSDFFREQKLTLFEKEELPILVNGNGEIIWLVGHRLDNRYKITEKTQKVFTLDYQETYERK